MSIKMVCCGVQDGLFYEVEVVGENCVVKKYKSYGLENLEGIPDGQPREFLLQGTEEQNFENTLSIYALEKIHPYTTEH